MASEETMKQIVDQCKVVAHLARALATVHDDYATIFASGDKGPQDIADSVGRRTARIMETLGDILNGMDAVSDGDEWTSPIFREANRLWLVPDMRKLIAKDRQLISEHRDLLEALKSLCDGDASYFESEIRIPCKSHGEAISRLRKARDVAAKASA